MALNVALRLLAAFALTWRGALGDLPVHCLHHQVEGEWTFVLGPPSEHRSSCGHLNPDREDAQPPRSLVDGNGTTTEHFLLKSPNVAVHTSRGSTGTWTMVYDEGFEVKLNDRRFFAFSNFTFEKDSSTGKLGNVSHCGSTMVGWYSNDKRTQFGCYYGYKGKEEEQSSTDSGSQPQNQSSGVADHKVDHEAMSQKVSALNAKLNLLQLPWKAQVMDRWLGKSRAELNSLAGLQRRTPMRDLQGERLAHSPTVHRRTRSFLQRPRLPTTWDWSNLTSDQNFLEPVMDQGDCGSCYAASSMRMLTARHKIAQKDPDILPWSIGLPLFCGEYNQGCKGGFPFLMAKWSSELGLLPATCLRYDTGGKCKLECDLANISGKRYKAANHRYVGSFYGNSSTEEIMLELYEHGPLVLSFEPQEDFMYYSEGVYRSTPEGSKAKSPSPSQEWTRVDHAVLLVGYGEDNGTKYWKLQNSWGPDWGEDGFFRMLRGEDESGIESSAEAADVVEDEQDGQQLKAFFDARPQ